MPRRSSLAANLLTAVALSVAVLVGDGTCARAGVSDCTGHPDNARCPDDGNDFDSMNRPGLNMKLFHRIVWMPACVYAPPSTIEVVKEAGGWSLEGKLSRPV